MHRVAGDVEAELVRLAVDVAGLEASAREPHGETPVVVVATVGFAALRHRRATELAAPDDEGVVEEAALFEIAHQGGARFLGVVTVLLESLGQLVVLIPAAMKELDDTDAALEKSARVAGVAWLAMILDPVHFEHGLGFVGKVHEFGRAGLHAKRRFVALDTCGDIRITAVGEGDLVELMPHPFDAAFANDVGPQWVGGS